jgi:hypothetical protein
MPTTSAPPLTTSEGQGTTRPARAVRSSVRERRKSARATTPRASPIMRLVLDASITIAATRASDPFYASARAQMERALQGTDAVVVPAFFFVEVAGALARQASPSPTFTRFSIPSPAPLMKASRSDRGGQRRAARRHCMQASRPRCALRLARGAGRNPRVLDEEILTRGAARVQTIWPQLKV